MKQYKKVELVAKNQVSGSYAAGCPTKDRECSFIGIGNPCKKCEVSR